MAQQYRPLFKLDSGGMAEVYVAESEALQGFKKRVAIKRILPGMLKDERFVRMFLDEARLSLHLSHANIVSVFDIGKSDNTYFIVMEYVEGCTLKSAIEHVHNQGRRVSVALTVWVLNEILKGLDYAHNLTDADGRTTLGIVHRDISPPNILFSWNGEVKLADFGLAKATTQLESTDPGVVKGKFSYLSPEAAWGQPVDHRTDIFAVGILAYEMLTGRRLFLGESDWQTIELVRSAQIPSIVAQNPDVPPELEQIVLRSLAADVNTRYQSSGEFADDLLSVLFSKGLRVSARDLSALLVEIRASRPRLEEKIAELGRGNNLILELLADEIAQFRSLDDDDVPGGDGSRDPLTDTYDPASPLAFGDFDMSAAPLSVVVPMPTPVSVVTSPPVSPSHPRAGATQVYSAIPLSAPPVRRGGPSGGQAAATSQTYPAPQNPGVANHTQAVGVPTGVFPAIGGAPTPAPPSQGGGSQMAPLPIASRFAGPVVETQYGAIPVASSRLQSPAPRPMGPSPVLIILIVLLVVGGAIGAAFALGYVRLGLALPL